MYVPLIVISHRENFLKSGEVVKKITKADNYFVETLRFYKALSEIGTDFTLMSQAFGRFSRNELKVCYLNLNSHVKFDVTILVLF